MSIALLRFLGERTAHKTLEKHAHTGGILDIKLGFSMLKDRRVPFRPKFLAVGLGAGLIALLIALEIPLESLIALVLPVLGLVADVLTSSLEAIIGTVGVAAILVPHFAPKALTQQLRNERDGIIEVPFTPMAAGVETPHANYDMPHPPQKFITPQR